MSFQIIGKRFGYRLGYLGRYQRRRYLKIVDNQIQFTDSVDESGLFSREECIELLPRLFGEVNRQYFISEDSVSLYAEF